MLQLIFTWRRYHHGDGCLPSGIGRLVRFGSAPLSGEYTVVIELFEGWTKGNLRAEVEVIGRDGLVRLAGNNLEGWVDPDLRRLSGQWANTIA
ncbi:hypothetical protein D3C83_80260 [compost metagenome]